VWALAQATMALGTALPLITQALWALAVSGVFVGGTFMVATMAGLQLAREETPADPTPLLARMTVAFAAGQIAGPLLVRAIGHDRWAGWDGIAWANATATVLLALTAAWLGRDAVPLHARPRERGARSTEQAPALDTGQARQGERKERGGSGEAGAVRGALHDPGDQQRAGEEPQVPRPETVPIATSRSRSGTRSTTRATVIGCRTALPAASSAAAIVRRSGVGGGMSTQKPADRQTSAGITMRFRPQRSATRDMAARSTIMPPEYTPKIQGRWGS
jgi:MFS family permease